MAKKQNGEGRRSKGLRIPKLESPAPFAKTSALFGLELKRKGGKGPRRGRKTVSDFLRISDCEFRLPPSFLQRHIPTDDAFQMSVFGAHQQRAVFVQ